jgi:putative DNA primase/helicase
VAPRDALGIADAGLGKTPALPDDEPGYWKPLPRWQHGITDKERRLAIEAGANAGLILGVPLQGQQYIALDFDLLTGTSEEDFETKVALAIKQRSIRTIVSALGGNPIWVRDSRPGRAAVLFRMDPAQPTGRKDIVHLTSSKYGDVGKIEVLARGQQIVVAGEHSFTQQPLLWWRSDRPDVRVAAPTVDDAIPVLKDRENLNKLLEAVLASLTGWQITGQRTRAASDYRATASTHGAANAEDRAAPSPQLLIELLRVMAQKKHNLPHPDWLRVMLGVIGSAQAMIRRNPETAEFVPDIREAFLDFCDQWISDKGDLPDREKERAKFEVEWSKRDAKATWRTLCEVAEKDLGIDISAIKHEAAGMGFEAVEAAPLVESQDIVEKAAEHVPAPTLEEMKALARAEEIDELTEDETALAFADAFGNLYKFDHNEDVWFKFEPAIGWVRDTKLSIESAARAFVRRAAQGRRHDEASRRAAGRIGFSSAVHRACKSDPKMATDINDWSVDPFVLGYPGGYVDLRTGKLMPAKGSDRIRNRVSVIPADKASCPIWLKFLEEATGKDKPFQAWLKRYAGYLLTGSVKEEMVAFLYGDGGNGKGVFLKTITSIIGEYAYQAPAELFKENTRLNREPHIAQIAGKRLIVSTELEAGSRLAESFLKDLSGNEGKLKGKHLYCDPFEFTSYAKPLLVGNHAPKLHGRSPAMERRLKVLPFTNKPAKKDENLKDKLVAEYPGILAWMIEGCVEWQAQGLGTCEVIARASGAYFDTQDFISQWLDECCVLGASEQVSVKKARDSYNRWLQARGEPAVTLIVFDEEITRKAGIRRLGRKTAGEMYGGFSLIPESSDDWQLALPGAAQEPPAATIH